MVADLLACLLLCLFANVCMCVSVSLHLVDCDRIYSPTCSSSLSRMQSRRCRAAQLAGWVLLSLSPPSYLSLFFVPSLPFIMSQCVSPHVLFSFMCYFSSPCFLNPNFLSSFLVSPSFFFPPLFFPPLSLFVSCPLHAFRRLPACHLVSSPLVYSLWFFSSSFLPSLPFPSLILSCLLSSLFLFLNLFSLVFSLRTISSLLLLFLITSFHLFSISFSFLLVSSPFLSLIPWHVRHIFNYSGLDYMLKMRHWRANSYLLSKENLSASCLQCWKVWFCEVAVLL